MSNSSLITIKVLADSSNYTVGRSGKKIEEVTLHHMAGVLSAEECGKIFQQKGRGASAHYGIGKDGKKAQYVDEKDTAWANANWDSNCRAVTIEMSNSSIGGNYPVSDVVLNSTIELIVDIFKRNNLGTCIKGKNLTWHSMYSNTYCPGDYVRSKIDYIVEQVNKKLNYTNTNTNSSSLYKVQVGAFSKKENAKSYAKELEGKGISTCIIQKDGFYKVQCGAFSDASNARNMAQKLNNLGYNTYIEGLNESSTVNQGTAYRVNCEYPNIRSGASLNASIVRRPKKGDIIYVIDTVNGFLKLSDGTYLKEGYADKV